MPCPSCGVDNIAGSDYCDNCGWDLHQTDIPIPQDAVEELFLHHPVREIVTTQPVTIGPDASMSDGIALLHKHRVRALLVLDEGALVGILTEHDTVRALGVGQSGASMRVAEVMTSAPFTVDSDAPVGLAAKRFLVDSVHHLPVVEGGKILGIVAMGDVLEALIAVLLGETES